MTSYLLIDLDKSSVGCVAPTGETRQVFLFAKKKNNRQLAQAFAAAHPQVAFVKVGKDEKLAEILSNQLKKLLKSQPEARFLIDSPRKKVVKLVDKLLNRFPEANVMLLDVVQNDEENESDKTENDKNPTHSSEPKKETSPSQGQFNPPLTKLPEMQQPQKNPASKTKSKQPKIPVAKKPSLLPKESPNWKNSLSENSMLKQQVLLDKVAKNHDDKDGDETDESAFAYLLSRLNEAIEVLTKGYPKKKEQVLGELMQALQVSHSEAEMMFKNLVSHGMMKLENGNMVKITNLIHLLKLK